MLSSSTGRRGLKRLKLTCARLQSAPTVLGLRKPCRYKTSGRRGLKPRQLTCARLQSAPTVLVLRKPCWYKTPGRRGLKPRHRAYIAKER